MTTPTTADALAACDLARAYIALHPDITQPPPPPPVGAVAPVITPWTMPTGVANRTSSIQLSTAGQNFNGVSGKGTFGLLFKGVAGANLDNIAIADVETDGVSTILRFFGGSARNHIVAHVRQKNAGYQGGAGAGGLYSSNTDITGFNWSDIDVEITRPWTNPNDAYATICLAGKDANDVCDYGIMRDIRLRCLISPSWDYSAYLAAHPTADQTPYPNGDGVGAEVGYKNIDADRIYVEGFPDGGFDIKAFGFRLRDGKSVRNRNGYRRWARSETGRQDGTVEIVEPRETWLMRMGVGDYVVDNLLMHPAAPNTPANPTTGPAFEFKIDQQHETDANLLPGKRRIIVKGGDLSAFSTWTDQQLVHIAPPLKGLCELVLPNRTIAL